jgi:hypothetical protein
MTQISIRRLWTFDAANSYQLFNTNMPEWTRVKMYDKIYYWNTNTNTVSWENPCNKNNVKEFLIGQIKTEIEQNKHFKAQYEKTRTNVD